MRTVLCFLIWFFVQTIEAQEYFFYVRGQKAELEATDRISISFSTDMGQEQLNNFRSVEPDLMTMERFGSDKTFTCRTNKRSDLKSLLARLKNQPNIENANPVFRSDNLDAVYFDRFIVKFKPGVSSSDIEELILANSVVEIPTTLARKDFYIFRVTKNSDRSTLEMANLFYESLPCEWAMPDFYISGRLHGNPNDTYFSNQWYFHNTGQTGGTTDADIDAPEAWDISTGSSSIVVAVIDEGVCAHEDLPSNRIVAGYDYVGSGDNDPSPEGNEAHGMATAGIIAASQNNNTGVSGLAPNCKIMPIRIFDQWGTQLSVSIADVASAIGFAEDHSARIICNSWGYNYSDPNEEVLTPIRDAINSALNAGIIVIASAGNEANRTNSDYHYVEFPANIPGVIAVGATDQFNQIQNYSPRGGSLSVVAPSGSIGIWQPVGVCQPLLQHYNRQELQGNIWSLDMSGQPGWNPGNYGLCGTTNYNEFLWSAPGGDATSVGNYTAHFGGTSAAAPQVAGVAALILSVNPNLTGTQVKDIILQSADDMGTTGFDSDFGYGRLNAYKALLLTIGTPPVVTAPVAGTKCSGVYRIQWTGPISSSYSLYLSTNGGVTFPTTIATSAVSQLVSGSYYHDWSTSGLTESNCKILIVDNTDQDLKDTSDVFEIDNNPPADPQDFQVARYQVGPQYRPRLTWTATAESDLAGFFIERKIDTDWEVIDSVAASVRSYIDYQVLIWANQNYETAYYRIRAYDTGRLFSNYTPEQSIDFHFLLKSMNTEYHDIPTRFELLGNFPNPFNPSTSIK